jgi:hypothetical protein
MKTQIYSALLAATLALTGCGKSNSVDTPRLTKTFATATGDIKYDVDTAVFSLKRHDFATALPPLVKAFKSAGLTADQKWALSDTITQTALLLENTKSKSN